MDMIKPGHICFEDVQKDSGRGIEKPRRCFMMIETDSTKRNALGV